MNSKPIQLIEINDMIHALCSDGSIWMLNGLDWVNLYTVNKKKSTPKVNNIEDRRKVFISDLELFIGQYTKPIIKEFYNYWSEYNQAGNKMRWELQPTWSITQRLGTWAKNAGINKATGVKHVEPAKQISIEDIEQNSARDAQVLKNINEAKKGK